MDSFQSLSLGASMGQYCYVKDIAKLRKKSRCFEPAYFQNVFRNNLVIRKTFHTRYGANRSSWIHHISTTLLKKKTEQQTRGLT